MKIADFEICGLIEKPNCEDLDYLDLSGRQHYYKQGYYGQNVTVAVVDTGVFAGHPELKGRVLSGYNFCCGGNPGDTNDDHFHGTHVAGIVAGEKCGVAPKARIVPVKTMAESGKGDVQWIIDSMYWLDKWNDEKGNRIDIVCMSLTAEKSEFTPEQFESFHQSVKNLVSNGTIVIVASGNTCMESELYPGCFDEVITVGAVDHKEQRVFFSTIGNQVDVCQVGFNVLSAYYKGGYVWASGTSMSTPVVAGIAALLVSKYKLLFNRAIPEIALYEMLKMNTIDLGMPGTDIEYGAGFCTLDPSTKP